MTTYSEPGIFNALDNWGPGFGMSTLPADPANNALALQAAIDAAQASGNPNGAIVLIPSYSLDPTTGEPQYGAYPIVCPLGETAAIRIPNLGLGAPPISNLWHRRRYTLFNAERGRYSFRCRGRFCDVPRSNGGL